MEERTTPRNERSHVASASKPFRLTIPARGLSHATCGRATCSLALRDRRSAVRRNRSATSWTAQRGPRGWTTCSADSHSDIGAGCIDGDGPNSGSRISARPTGLQVALEQQGGQRGWQEPGVRRERRRGPVKVRWPPGDRRASSAYGMMNQAPATSRRAKAGEHDRSTRRRRSFSCRRTQRRTAGHRVH